ncbi:MAG TPA: DNA recombination protein RmuC [Caulobacteraceae bacterium]|nr:DNA recombination protein RmuC [Caulobacteraceae bacterium]
MTRALLRTSVMATHTDADIDEALAGFAGAKAALAAEAAAQALARRSEEAFQAQEKRAELRLEAQLKPVAETLAKFETHVAAAEKSRAEQVGELKAQIGHVLTASAATQEEARKLSQALRRGAGVQGRWGEQMLRNVLELAGLKAGIDFEEQVHLDADGAAHRPDVVVRLPGGGQFVIDAKCSLTAFLEAQESADEAAREAALARHAQSLKAHVQGLASRAYWQKLAGSPDFVAMFVPGDGFLAAALERSPDLMTQAMERRVVIVTPTSMFSLCKVVAYGWRAEAQSRNTDKIVELGRDLYKRLAVMGGHVHAMGRALDAAIGRYNQFVGSLESQVLAGARRFEELQADHGERRLPELPPIETRVRALSRLSGSAAEALEASLAAPAEGCLTASETVPTSGS